MRPPAPARFSPAGGPEPARRRRDVRASVLLGLCCLLVYNANLRSIGTGDTLPARYLPFGIWRFGSVLLDPIRDVVSEGNAQPYWIANGRAGHSLSLYPVVLPVLIAPLYLPAVGYLNLRGWTEPRLLRVAKVMEKLTASLLAASAAALLYLLLRRRAPPADALLLALAFAFGSNTWMIGSQALWQHGLAELLLAGALLLLTGPCTIPRALAAGALCGLIAGNRPPDALLAAALGLYGLRWAGQRALWLAALAAGAAVPLGLVLGYNAAAAGNILGAYGIPERGAFFHHGLLSGVAGLLVSPTRGLLVFSPFLLLVPAALWHGLRDRGTRALTLAVGVAALAQVLFYAKADWRAGYSWGPRWLTDLLPLLVWLLPPALAALRGAGRLAFVLAACASMAVQAVGAFWYTGASDGAIFAASPGRGEMRAAWDPRNTPFIAELRHGRALHDPAFTCWQDESRTLGSIDSVTAGGRQVEVVTAGTPLAIEGWALASGHSPAALEVTLDGQPHGVTATFFDRPDVRAALCEDGPAGWRIDLRTDGVAPGAHVLAAAVRVPGGAMALPVARWEIMVAASRTKPDATHSPRSLVQDPELGAAPREAAALLGSHQQHAGFWLTSYTAAPRFEDPRPEMNTFLTAMMIDLLDPVAAAAGLGENLARARAHLHGQIEASGLVRYHGRPDGPTIPSLGCAITPDADDTSLVWRLAAGDRRELLPRTVAVLARYRTGEGLYRTWLAPRERYECIDPGKDPNPTDAGIQMHVFLLLAQADPPAARALCGALDRALGENRLWVYYRMAPLVPLLRQADLRRAGCRLRLPAARLRTPVDGQEVWLAAGRLLERLLSADGPRPTPSETLGVLQSLAKDGFSFVRRSPPLLYHNDLTARTSRFYWSEDFGYALWLRLYMEDTRRNGDTRARP
ncbi:MAG TPA: hypothetical protein VHQ90_07845 [Thermoanaerobaculia bacterium]|nr:hypothetical protein [Thermoanaerobaculia bacterium]